MAQSHHFGPSIWLKINHLPMSLYEPRLRPVMCGPYLAFVATLAKIEKNFVLPG